MKYSDVKSREIQQATALTRSLLQNGFEMSDNKVVDLSMVRESKKLVRQLEKEEEEGKQIIDICDQAEAIADDMIESLMIMTHSDQPLDEDDVTMMQNLHTAISLVAIQRLKIQVQGLT